jgi:hypothetical protein
VLAEVVGPSLRWATARITKTTRTPTTDETPEDVGEREASSRPHQGLITPREGRPVRSTPGALSHEGAEPGRVSVTA